MSKNGKMNIMTCGASAVVMDDDGTITTSVDTLVNGVRRLFGKRGQAAPAKGALEATFR